LLCGNQSPEFVELEQAATYDGWRMLDLSGGMRLPGRGVRPDVPVLGHFWTFFHSLSVDLKKKMLAFVTGSNRIPIKGLAHSNFVVMYGGEDQDKLPESHVSSDKRTSAAECSAATSRSVRPGASELRSHSLRPPSSHPLCAFVVSAQTCFNQLVLPNYKSPETLRTKMLMAISECAEGFALK